MSYLTKVACVALLGLSVQQASAAIVTVTESFVNAYASDSGLYADGFDEGVLLNRTASISAEPASLAIWSFGALMAAYRRK
jgi:hypothetical protein